jgi:DNA-binding CsgD family transcriptional regulator
VWTTASSANREWEDGPVLLATSRDEATPLLGRGAEQALLRSLLDEVATRGQALVLRGEPGIGKSRLLAEAARTARERGMTVLTATGVQSEAHLPFAGLHQLLRPVRERAADLPPIQRDALDAAFGLTHDVAPEHYRIAMASLDLLSDVAGDAPLLLLVEDAHWLDPLTADVLAFVARRIESDPVLILAAARDGYPSALADAGLPEHRLAGLDDATAAALLDAAAPRLPLAARTRVLHEAGSNPLALLELPAVLGQPDEEPPVPGGVPLTERLEHAFAARVSDLPEATRLVLLVAALSDGDSASEILQAAVVVAGAPLDLDALEPAVDAALIDLDVTSVSFRHPLVRSAVRQSAVGRDTTEWIAINLRHARALLADDEREAVARFEEALGADLDRWPFWRGRLLLAHGRWLRRHRRVMDSRAPLREARDMFDAIGASSWGDQARSELRASGERSRRRVPEARDQLTAQELQIAQLAAQGLSNREIGQRLYLSHRTISTHLYRVFPKLGITSRGDLGAALASGAETR